MKWSQVFLFVILFLATGDAKVSKRQFKAFMQTLWDTDKDQVKGIKCQFQSLAKFQDDSSELPLFLSVDRRFMQRQTYKTFLRLLNNYIRDPKKAESRSQLEIGEEKDFLATICKTDVMKQAFKFLTVNGYFKGNMAQFENYLLQIWFGIYPRASRDEVSSCGFEHVFVGEYKGQTVNGLHNWVQFYLEERSRKINYKGYIKYRFLEHNVTILTNAFSWQGHEKVKGGMFIGTSPEMELAMYTVCFLVWPNGFCGFSIDGVYISVITYQKNYEGQVHVATAFPSIS